MPDPCGEHENFAEHFKDPLREALDLLAIQVTEISQTEMYTSGAYTDQIVLAMRRRAEIGAVLARYRTKRTEVDDEDEPKTAVYYPFRLALAIRVGDPTRQYPRCPVRPTSRPRYKSRCPRTKCVRGQRVEIYGFRPC